MLPLEPCSRQSEGGRDMKGCFRRSGRRRGWVSRGGAVAPDQVLTAPVALGLFLGLYLDDEVNVVSDRTQIGLHAEIRAFGSAAGGKTSQVNFVKRVLTDFVYDNVERDRFGHAMQGELSRDRPSVIVLFHKFSPTYVISGNSVTLNQSAPLRSLSRGANWVCKLLVLMVTFSLLAATLLA